MQSTSKKCAGRVLLKLVYGLQALAQVLTVNASLRDINFAENCVGEKGAEAGRVLVPEAFGPAMAWRC